MRLVHLEAVRGFAALYVVLHHSMHKEVYFNGINIALPFRFGQEAVILFFLLSGFVINYSYSKGSIKTFRNFFLKRFYRLYIPLFFVFILGYLFNCYRAGTFIDANVGNLLMNILMLQDISSLKPGVLAGPYMGNSPLWSLSYEWWFYILYFPIVRFIKKSDVFVFILASCSAVVYCFWPYFLQRLFMYFSIWWTGVYVSNIYLNGDREYTLNKLFYPLITLSLISVVLFTNCLASYFSDNLSSFGVHPILEFRHFVFSVFVVLFSIGWMRLSLFGFDYILKPFSLLAPISYGIYISHYYLVSNADYFAFVGNKFVEWVGYMVVVIVFSYVLEVVVYPRVLGAVSNFHGK